MTIKRFDLEFWKAKKELLDVITEYAEPVEIVKTDCIGKYPILGVIFDGDTDDACFYTEDGVSMSGDKIFLTVNSEKLKKYRRKKLFFFTLYWIITFLILAYQSAATVHAISTKRLVAFNVIALLFIAACLVLQTFFFIKIMKTLDDPMNQ